MSLVYNELKEGILKIQGEKISMKNYIWDFDGTLYNTYPEMERALKEAIFYYGEKAPDNLLLKMLQTSIRDILNTHYGNKKHEIYAYYQTLEKNYQQHPLLFPHAKEILAFIILEGGQNFIITHRNESAKEILAKDNLLGLFNGIITAEDELKRKPDPESLEFLVEKYQLAKKDSVYIGDRPLDMEFAKNAQLEGIYFDPFDLNLVKEGLKVHSLEELKTIGR